jgi:hypothetical protein
MAEMTETAREKRAELLSKRVALLQQRADELRENALKLAGEMAVAKGK